MSGVSHLPKDSEVCDAEEDGWSCTLDEGHAGPHEAWGLDRLFCRWWAHGRIPRQDLWRDCIVQDTKESQ